MIGWDDLPEPLRDMLVRAGIDLAKRAASFGVEQLQTAFPPDYGDPDPRHMTALTSLTKAIEGCRHLSIYERMTLKSAEARHLAYGRHFLNLVRKQMIAYDSFVYLWPGITNRNALLLFQTPSILKYSGAITSMAMNLFGNPWRMRDTKPWTYCKAQRSLVGSDIDGLRNPTIVIRELPLELVHEFAPFSAGRGLADTGLAMNLFCRVSRAEGHRPWPDTVGIMKPIESINTVSWNQVSTYSRYDVISGSALPCSLMPMFDIKPFSINTLAEIAPSLVAAAFVLHPSFDPSKK